MITAVADPHDHGCPTRNRTPLGGHSDAAKRFSDNMNLHLAADRDNAVGKWISVALRDGSSDGVLYDSFGDAQWHHQNKPLEYTFAMIPPTGMNPCRAESLLRFYRQGAAAGFRQSNPHDLGHKRRIIPSLTQEGFSEQMFALLKASQKR